MGVGACSQRGRGSLYSKDLWAGGRLSSPEAGWPGPLAPNFMSCPSQAEGEETPLDAFQLPASVAHEDVSSPEPEPTGEPHLPAQPWEALSGLWDLCCPVWRLLTVKVLFKSQEFPGVPGVRTLGPRFNTRLVNPTGHAVWHKIITGGFLYICKCLLKKGSS